MKAKYWVVLLAAGTVAGWVIHHNSKRRAAPVAAAQPAELPVSAKPERMPRLPAPRMPATGLAVEPQSAELRRTNLLAGLLKGEEVRLRSEQVEPYLQKSGRSAESLLAAFRATQDVKLLREALEKYAGDPRVSYAAYFAPTCNGDLKDDFAPGEGRKLLDAFKAAAPDNPLANLLSARDYFASGQSDRAVEELQAAAGKSNFQDYTTEFMQNAEDAYRAAGYSDAEAKAMGVLSQPLPDLAALKGLTQNLVELAGLYRQAGDGESAQAALQMGLALGERFTSQPDTPESSIHEMVGLKIQQLILESLDPASPYDSTGRTVKDQLAELGQRRDALMEQGKQEAVVLPSLSEQDLAGFLERMKVLGEAQAWQWAKNKGGR
jgi:hypothetical protein